MPSPAVIDAIDDPQARFDRVLGAYLAGEVSVARAGELLGTGAVPLRVRLERLGVPLRFGPQTAEELRDEVAAAEHWVAPRA